MMVLPAASMGLAAPQTPSDADLSPGSVARQLMLKYRLQKISNGTLTASLHLNRRQWQVLGPDQRHKYRRDLGAFLKTSPNRQKALLEHYEKLVKLSPQKQVAYQSRAGWLKVIVASFTPAERKELRTLTPGERARRLVQRRQKLTREGKFPLMKASSVSKYKVRSQGTTQPAGRK